MEMKLEMAFVKSSRTSVTFLKGSVFATNKVKTSK